MDAFRLQTGAVDFKAVAGIQAQECFCHLAARGIAGA